MSGEQLRTATVCGPMYACVCDVKPHIHIAYISANAMCMTSGFSPLWSNPSAILDRVQFHRQTEEQRKDRLLSIPISALVELLSSFSGLTMIVCCCSARLQLGQRVVLCLLRNPFLRFHFCATDGFWGGCDHHPGHDVVCLYLCVNEVRLAQLC